MTRRELESRWLDLTRRALPSIAAERGWPVSADHCFMRILLDNAFAGRWTRHIDKRPAFRHAPHDALQRAVTMAERVLDGRENLHVLNERSLAWRGKAR